MASPPIDELHFSGAPDVGDVPGPETRRLLDRQHRTESSAVLYPRRLPFAPAEAKGATIRDADGNLFLDCFAGIGVTNVGHSNPYVVEAATEQTGRLAHTLDFPTEVRLDLVDAIDEIAPGGLSGDSRVLFGGPTGSDAVEATIKLAKLATGNTGLIAFRGGYHGGTAGALSLTSDREEKRDYAPLLPNVEHVRYPYPFRQDVSPERAVETALADVEAVLDDEWSGLSEPAGIWVEPIQGEGGVVVPPEGFLPRLSELAAEHDVPLIVDEIQTGFGRTGRWFASEWDDVTPDIMPVGKAIGGSLPLSATVYDEALDDVVEPGAHTGTFRGYVPAMRASLRAIEYVRDHDLLAHARSVGEMLRDRLEAAAAESPLLAEVRGRGLYLGLEFVDGDGAPARDHAVAVQRRCYEEGVVVWGGGRGANCIRLIPPLVITEPQAETAAAVIADAVADVTRDALGGR